MSKAEKKPGIVLAIHHPDDLKGTQKVIGGSMSDGWNDAIAGQVVNTLWTKHLDDDEANKLSRTYSALVETLNRHRGKGQQKMTVEHVHVYEGGQAIVGNVETRGVGSHRNQRNNPPCTWICTRRYDAERGRGAGACVSRRG